MGEPGAAVPDLEPTDLLAPYEDDATELRAPLTVGTFKLATRRLAVAEARVKALQDAIELLDAECERRQQDVSELSTECERWHDEVASMDHARDCKHLVHADGRPWIPCNCARSLLGAEEGGE